MKNKGQRADKILSALFPKLSRSKIKDLIENHKVKYKEKNKNQEQIWVLLDKAGTLFDDTYEDLSRWKMDEAQWTRFVSRGGLKLEGALRHFNLDVQGQIGLDIGLSTGGFSDCLIQNGVQKVLGVDVGREQLHSSLKSHDQLVWFDKINARNPLPEAILFDFFGPTPPVFDIIVVDVSFISLGKVVPSLVPLLATGGYLMALVKPQFELGPEALNRKGVLKSQRDPMEAVEKNVGMFLENGLKTVGHCQSVIEGENGNKEFFVLSEKE